MRFDSLSEALKGSSAPEDVLRALVLVDVLYMDFNSNEQVGQLVIHHELEADVREIFAELYAIKFPIERVVPIAAYGWDDDASMADNNTSAFNYRMIVGQDRLSNHSLGRAIDINPMQNPYYAVNGNVYPAGVAYDPHAPGTITAGSDIVHAFAKRGWQWLGERAENTDYQHFQKL